MGDVLVAHTFTASPQLILVADILLGVEAARNLALASFVLLVYDYFLTLGDEIRYFWGVPWSKTRVLFLTNRYLAPVITTMVMICFFGENLSLEFCGTTIHAIFLLNVVASAIFQIIIITRIWFMFSHIKFVRWVVVGSFFAALVAALYFVQGFLSGFQPIGLSVPGFRKIGCLTTSPSNLWRVFFPSFSLHTLLYICTTVRALQDRRMFKRSSILKKILRDGGFFYLIVFVSIGYTAIGSMSIKQFLIRIPAIHSNLFVVVNSISVSRVMLSFRQFAANLGSTDDYLLNNFELSRVNWKLGDREGEIIVELDRSGYEDDLVGESEKGQEMRSTRS